MQAQQYSHESYKLLVTGNSGSGKTSYFLQFLHACEHERIFVYDHQGEIADRMGIAPLFNRGQIGEAIDRGERVICYDPSEEFPGCTREGFDFYSELVFELGKIIPGKKLFAVDEIQQLVDASTVPWELSQVIETGRRRGIDTAFISQQPNIIHNRIRNALTECVSFMHNDERAVKFMVDLGFPEDELRALRQFEFISKNLRSGQLYSGKSNWRGASDIKKEEEQGAESSESVNDKGPVDENNSEE